MDIIWTIAVLNVAVTTAIIYLFVKFYLPSYIREKGRNLATKEDIEAITEKIESVKTEHARQLELYKREVDLSEKRREESRAVVEILSEWLRPENVGQEITDHNRWKLQTTYWRNILTLDRELIGILFPRLANIQTAVSHEELIVQTRKHILAQDTPDLKETDLNKWWPKKVPTKDAK